jgi:antitoxin VapB
MVKQLNIKSDRLYAKVERLAELTGTTLTGAVEAAVDEQLGKAERARDIEARLKRVLEITDEMAANMIGPPISSEELQKELYDERGLPVGSWTYGD